MVTPYLGEVRPLGFGFAPKGWALCNGQTMAINQSQALFALLGTMYGGNGVTTFQLPNLQSRVPVHRSTDGTYVQGGTGGSEFVTLITNQAPSHLHSLVGTTTAGNREECAFTLGASPTATNYYYSPGTTALTALNPSSIGMAGNGQGHPNIQPYLTINYSIALQGVFPSRN
jgi:microcystin-dependent protein